MTLFITSSPFVDGADRAILSNDNGFLDRIREALPPFPRCLFVSSSPDRHDLNCRFGADVFSAFAEAGIPFSSYSILDGETAEYIRSMAWLNDRLFDLADTAVELKHGKTVIRKGNLDDFS